MNCFFISPCQRCRLGDYDQLDVLVDARHGRVPRNPTASPGRTRLRRGTKPGPVFLRPPEPALPARHGQGGPPVAVRAARRDPALLARGRLVRGHVHPQGHDVPRERRGVQPRPGGVRRGRGALRPRAPPRRGRQRARAGPAGYAGRGPRRVRLWAADLRRAARRERHDVHRVRRDALGHGSCAGQGRAREGRPRRRGWLSR